MIHRFPKLMPETFDLFHEISIGRKIISKKKKDKMLVFYAREVVLMLY